MSHDETFWNAKAEERWRRSILHIQRRIFHKMMGPFIAKA